ncbi:MAG TPA: ABC transporter substrate-binding protein [Trebonia sp.]|jgi:multiple sugar transport system substrate-binding protein|nr:ABC transporter substrate-binding protein [Trebonia sp.]
MPARSARALAVLAAGAALLAGCGLLPAAPGTLAAADGPCGTAASTSTSTSTAAAGGRPGPAALTNAPGQLTFAIGSDDSSWLQPLVTTWNRQHPAEQVLPQYLLPSANDQLAQLSASLQARSCFYDVIDMDVVWTAQFASNGWIVPLPAGQVPTAGYLAPAVDTARYQGRLYAVPDYTNADLLYYRSDLVATPPATWAQLAADAQKLARPGSGRSGYAATLAPYEGLTVSFAEAVQSAGGSILGPGPRVTVDSRQAQAGLGDLVNGVVEGWIPQADLGYEETQAQQAFESGHFLFMSNWPDSYAAMQSDRGSQVAGRFSVAALPSLAPGVPGSSSLGGANLAISAYSRHQQAALAFIKYLTDAASERAMFTTGGFPPALASLYDDPGLRAAYPYLAVLKQSIETARPRPAITNYDQASLAIASAVHAALAGQELPQQALHDLQAQLTQIVAAGGGGLPRARSPGA